jgi:hypothetical protein
VEVLEALVQLEREHDTRIDVVPRLGEKPLEVHRVVRLDQRCIAEVSEQLRIGRRESAIHVAPPHVTLDGPVSAVGSSGVTSVEGRG